jgi:hypothetical protein
MYKELSNEDVEEKKIITPYQIVKEIHDKSQNIEEGILGSIKQTLEMAKEIRSAFEPIIAQLNINGKIFGEISAVDGGNSIEKPRMGWYFGTHGAVLLSNKYPLQVQGDIINCPASGNMIRYIQLCRDIEQLNLVISCAEETKSREILLFDGSSIPLGWYAQINPAFPFEGFGRYPSYGEMINKGFFDKDSVYNTFFAQLINKPIIFIPKSSATSIFINRKLSHFNIPRGIPDVVLLSLFLRENEYISPPIPYYEGVSYSHYRHYTSNSGWAYYFNKQATQIYITYFRPSKKSPVFKIEFPKACIPDLNKILLTFKEYYSPSARMPVPLWLADKLAKGYSSLTYPISRVVKNNLVQHCKQINDVELLKAVEVFFH